MKFYFEDVGDENQIGTQQKLFGFSYSKLSSLCINGGSFLYPGEKFQIFPTEGDVT